MASVGNDITIAGGHFQDSDSDVELLMDPIATTIEDETKFKPIRAKYVISIQILTLVAEIIIIFTLPIYCSVCLSSMSAYSIVVLSHAVLWGLCLIFDRYYEYEHILFRRFGYLEFYRKTRAYRKTPLYIFSIGNVFLLVVLTIVQEFCSDSEYCPKQANMKRVLYFQIITCFEIAAAILMLLLYLVEIVKFNRAKSLPDVEHDELTVSYMQDEAPCTELGFRDQDGVDDVLEKQADFIRYLKEHNASLCRKLLKVTTELTALKSI